MHAAYGEGLIAPANHTVESVIIVAARWLASSRELRQGPARTIVLRKGRLRQMAVRAIMAVPLPPGSLKPVG